MDEASDGICIGFSLPFQSRFWGMFCGLCQKRIFHLTPRTFEIKQEEQVSNFHFSNLFLLFTYNLTKRENNIVKFDTVNWVAKCKWSCIIFFSNFLYVSHMQLIHFYIIIIRTINLILLQKKKEKNRVDFFSFEIQKWNIIWMYKYLSSFSECSLKRLANICRHRFSILKQFFLSW